VAITLGPLVGTGRWLGGKNYLKLKLRLNILPSLMDALEHCQATEEPIEADCFDCKTVTHYGKNA